MMMQLSSLMADLAAKLHAKNKKRGLKLRFVCVIYLPGLINIEKE